MATEFGAGKYPAKLPFVFTEDTVKEIEELERAYALDNKGRTISTTELEYEGRQNKPIGNNNVLYFDLQQYIIGTGNNKQLEVNFGIISTEDISVILELYNSTVHTFSITNVYISKGAEVEYNVLTLQMLPKTKGLIELTAKKMVGVDFIDETIYVELEDEDGNKLKIPVRILGERVKLAPVSVLVEPDFNAYSDTLFFYNRIFTSLNGTESRKNFLLGGKYKTSFTISVGGKQKLLSILDNLIKYIKLTAIQPLWSLLQSVKQTNENNYKKVYIQQGTEDLFTLGEYVAVYNKNDTGFISKVIQISDGVITLESNIKILDLNYYVMPCKIMQITDAVSVDYPTQNFTKINITLQEL